MPFSTRAPNGKEGFILAVNERLDGVMTFEDAKAALKDEDLDFLDLAPDGGYICPDCGNGSGSDGSGMHDWVNKYGERQWHCFKCGKTGDVLKWFMIWAGIENPWQGYKAAFEFYGYQVEDDITRGSVFSLFDTVNDGGTDDDLFPSV